MTTHSVSGRFFHEFADTFDTFYDGKRSRLMQWVDRRFRRDMFVRFARTFELLDDLHGQHILDIGCGSGPYLVEALRRGAAHVTGLDPARRMLDLARQRAEACQMHDRMTLVEGSFPDNRPDRTFDGVIVMGVMDYVADAHGFIEGLCAATAGRAVVSFPSTHWFRTPFRKVRYALRRCPVYFYTDARIRQLLNDVGARHFQIEKIPGAGLDYIVCIDLRTA